MTLATALVAHCSVRPCDEALTWLGRRRLPSRAWAECPQGKWLLWILALAGICPPLEWVAREIVAPAFGYAASAMEAAGPSEWAAILREHEAALRGVTEETAAGILSAAQVAGDAAGDAYVDARAAAEAVEAAWSAVWAAEAASWAVEGATAAATYAADAAGATGDAEHQRCADAVRRLYPEPPPEVLALLGTARVPR